MSFYLLDNPPASPQFHPTRTSTPTWAVSIHTSEGPRDARALAGFISRRSDPGSYATIVDASNTVDLVPHTYTTFSVAASGYNSRTYAACIAGRSSDLFADDPYTQSCIERVGAVVANLWSLVGVDPRMHARWIGTGALSQPGLFCHGDVQPWDRTDAWSVHPERDALDRMLVSAVLRNSKPVEDDDMKSVMVLDPVDGKTVWECFGLWRRWVRNPKDFDMKRFLGVQYLDGTSDAGFRKFLMDTTSEVK